MVSQINSPVASNENAESAQIQTKRAITVLQRLGESNRTISPFAGMVQPQEAIAGGEASTELASAINGAKGGGQPLEAGLQRSMGQAMGADFSGVRVHTDARSDQLNQSIQAKAFTTGQDVFFRQGAYQPRSRGGQELISHELTHVVQQNGKSVQRSLSNSPKPEAGKMGRGLLIQCAGKIGEFKNQQLLDGHFYKHVVEKGDAGEDFATADAYEQAAMGVINSASDSKTKGENTYYWKDSTGQFVVVRGGFIRSMFVPSAGKAYYEKQ